jgi:hypothetical protein
MAEEQARAEAKLALILRPGEQIIHQVKAWTFYVTRQSGVDPTLLALTEKRLLIAGINDVLPAHGYEWSLIGDLKTRWTWTGGCAMSFTTMIPRDRGRHTFAHGYDIGRKQAKPFADYLQAKWSSRRPLRPLG